MVHMEQRRLLALAALGGGAALAAHLLWLRQQSSKEGSNCKGRSRSEGSGGGMSVLWSSLAGYRSGLGSDAVPDDGAAAGPLQHAWAQSFEEVLVEVAVPGWVGPHHVSVKLGAQSLAVAVAQTSVVSGRLAGPISPQHSSWKLEGKGRRRILSICLAKVPPRKQRFAIWDSLLRAGGDGAGDDCQPAPDQAKARGGGGGGGGGVPLRRKPCAVQPAP